MRSEMITLIDKLTIANIPFEVTDDVMENKNNQVWYPSINNCICDVICHEYSYGGDKGLLEIIGLAENDCGDGVEGWLTADEVFARIYTHYNCRN